MKLSRSDIERIAYVSRLKLKGDEVEHYKDYLNKTLEYLSKITEVDTSNIDPKTRMTKKSNVFRNDTSGGQNEDKGVKVGFTNTKDTYYLVPAIIDGGQE